ncbi:MAG: beta-lactamase family protein, partial [Gemmatimonadetes bacterium]|nr:beta-lactamase family protein [Gemmatimonadota bacterium]
MRRSPPCGPVLRSSFAHSRTYWWWAVALGVAGCGSGADPQTPGSSQAASDRSYAAVAEQLTALAADEVERWGLPALSIALVDGDQTVWSAGFGEEAPGVPASGETVYRVGSVSKLFTDIGVMQLVEDGLVDLDAPVTTYLPDFRPVGAGAEAISLRQLMSHGSGLVREPPVGHYFDDSEPTLEATVASLTGTELVYPAGARTKYSNAAIATVGRVLEVVSEAPFVELLPARVLDPMGMTHTAFQPTTGRTDRLAQAQMWTLHGVRFPAPTFELGMAPAGSMYSTVEDLGRFMSALFARGEGEGGTILDPESLESMWEPQERAGGSAGYGLGFRLFELNGHRGVGHGGAIYGFSTELRALPDEGLGVVVVSSLDGSGTVVSRLAEQALSLMLASRDGDPLPTFDPPGRLPAGLAARLDGLYGSDDSGVRLLERNGRLVVQPLEGGSRYRLSASGDSALVTDDVHGAGDLLSYDPSGAWVEWRGARLERVDEGLPPAAPAALRRLIGEYGWDYNVLYIYEERGRLRALIEWFFDYPLTPSGTDAFDFPDFGLYHGEGVRFERDPSGAVTAAVAAGIRFPRRQVGTVEGVTFRIDPVQPVEDLREVALESQPPAESGSFRDSELVEVTTLDPSIALDIR